MKTFKYLSIITISLLFLGTFGLRGDANVDLFRAIDEGSLEKVKNALAHGADINAVDAASNTSALMRAIGNTNATGIMLGISAARNKLKEIANYLIDHEANVNYKDPQGRTPLMILFGTGSNILLDIADNLIKHGANINAVDNYGGTVFFYAITPAVDSDDLTQLQYLFPLVTNAKKPDKDGRTPLMVAIDFASYSMSPNKNIGKKIVDYLVNTVGIDVRAQDKFGRTALDYAKNLPEIKAIIQKALDKKK